MTKGQRNKTSNQLVYWLFLFLFTTTQISGHAQELLRRVEGNWSGVSLDPLGNFYIRNSTILMKYSPQGDSLYRYTQPLLGEIGSVDTSNPFRILVFHPGINTIVFLDKTLSPINDPVSLDLLGHSQTGAVCSSSQGGFWLFDPGIRKLYRYDSSLDPVIETLIRTGTRSGADYALTHLSESDNKVWLQFPNTTQIYDLFGSWLDQIPTSSLPEEWSTIAKELSIPESIEEIKKCLNGLIIRSSERCYLFRR